MSRIVVSLVATLLFTGFVFAQTFPNPTGFVNDYTKSLTNQTLIDLESTLINYEKQTGREISVVIVDSTDNEAIETYAVELFEKWQIGKKGEDNGILFLVAKSDRKIRIEVGYGLEGVMTDIQAKKILDDIVRPAFRLGDFEGGVKSGVSAIISILDNEPLPQSITTNVRRTIWDSDLGGFLVWMAFIGSSYFFSVAARSKSWHGGGIWGISIGTIVGILAASVLAWLILASVLGVLGLLFDYFVSRAYRKAKNGGHNPPWWAGGHSPFWSGFDRSGSSGGSPQGGPFGGGFGGGMSGGGGASSGW